MVWSTRVVRNSIFDDAQTFFFFFFHQKKNKKLSFKRPPPVLKRTSLTSSRVFVCVYVIERERGRGKERKMLLRRQNEETAARKRKKKWIKNQSLPPLETETALVKIEERERRKCWEDWWRNGWRARSAKKHRKRYDFWRARRPRVFAFLLLSFATVQ